VLAVLARPSEPEEGPENGVGAAFGSVMPDSLVMRASGHERRRAYHIMDWCLTS
jgi:hypothetical protein